MKIKTLKIFLMLAVACASFAFLAGKADAQTGAEDPNNPRTWNYFRILASSADDSLFVRVQDELLIEPKYESYILVVNISDPNEINQYVVIGDEASPDARRYAWSQLTPETQKGLINWAGANKENLNRQRLNYASVFTDVIRRIKIKEAIAPPRNERRIRSTTAYISPYLQIFGGEPLGIPLKQSIGLSFYVGTPYSGPFETDIAGANFHILGFSVGISGRIKELTNYTQEFGSTSSSQSGLSISKYNNIYAAPTMLHIAYVIPLGNFFEVGYSSTIGDAATSQVTGGPAPLYRNLTVTDSNNVDFYMRNNVLEKSYFNYEFRYPFTAFGSTRAKVYYGRLFGESHIGFVGREMRLAGSVFDARIDATLKGKRNFQLLIETMVQNIGESFSLSGFAIGPSLRLSRNQEGKFAGTTVFINVRLKIGDFYDPNL